jgi:hypothetical protein
VLPIYCRNIYSARTVPVYMCRVQVGNIMCARMYTCMHKTMSISSCFDMRQTGSRKSRGDANAKAKV